MKELINDYIHCTELEFLIKHPFAVLIASAAIALIALCLDYWLRGKKK